MLFVPVQPLAEQFSSGHLPAFPQQMVQSQSIDSQANFELGFVPHPGGLSMLLLGNAFCRTEPVHEVKKIDLF